MTQPATPSKPTILTPVKEGRPKTDLTKYGGLTVTKASAIPKDWGSFITLYGPAGAGKTTLAATAADSDYGSPMALCDAEGGARAVSHRDDIDVFEMTTWPQVMAYTEAIKGDANPPWKTIAWDNVSELAAINMRSIVGTDQPQIQHWGQNTADMLRFVRTWRDIARFKGINVIFVAWDEPEKDENGGIRRVLNMTPSFQKQYPGIVDMIGYLEVANNPPHYTRVLHFEPSPKLQAKFRRSQAEAALEIPFVIPNPTMDSLFRVLRGGEHWPAEKHKMPERASNSAGSTSSGSGAVTK